MAGYFTKENLVSITKSLMVVHGAALGVLASLIGSAAENPVMFGFLTPPLILNSIGFVLALIAYNLAEFTSPRDPTLIRLFTWVPVWASGFFVLLALAYANRGYLEMVAKLTAA